jgi:type II secretory pathway predicted ATPase ExeA
MYQAHFGIERAPFGDTVAPSAYVALPSRDTVLRRIRYAFDGGQGAAVVFGPPGTGKTLLARRLASGHPTSGVHVTFPLGSASEIIGQLAEEFGVVTNSPFSWNGILRELRSRLAALVARGERPLVIVDDAHVITDRAVFEALRLLLNFASDGPPDLFLLLVGGAEILLDLPRGLADRLAARCLIAPFTESETTSYILGRLADAGASSPLFTPEALVALHREGEGLARRLNRLADMSLLIAYAKELPIVDAETVSIAAREHNPDILAA